MACARPSCWVPPRTASPPAPSRQAWGPRVYGEHLGPLCRSDSPCEEERKRHHGARGLAASRRRREGGAKRGARLRLQDGRGGA
eukprot:5584879-Prymnesium_polylepis.1